MFYLNPLAGSDHIARLYRFRQRNKQGNPGLAAFLLRPGEEFLSCNWLEYFHPNSRNRQIAGTLRALRAKMTVGSQARLAVMSIEDVLRSCAAAGTLVEVKPTGEERDPSHTGIYGYVHDNREVAAILADGLPHQIYPAA